MAGALAVNTLGVAAGVGDTTGADGEAPDDETIADGSSAAATAVAGVDELGPGMLAVPPQPTNSPATIEATDKQRFRRICVCFSPAR